MPIQPLAARAECRFETVVPATAREGQTFEVRALAVDNAPAANTTHDKRTFRLGARPFALSISPRAAAPRAGPTWWKGTGFAAGTRVLVGGVPLSPGGGPSRRRRRDPRRTDPRAHPRARAGQGRDAGRRHGAGDALSVPPRADHRAGRARDGPPEQDTVLRVFGANFTLATRAYVGPRLATAVPLLAQTWVSPEELKGLAPPGQGPATVWVYDPDVGWGAREDAFRWMGPGAPALDAAAPDAAAPAPDAGGGQ